MLYDILKAARTDIAPDSFTRLAAQSFFSSKKGRIRTHTGTLPLSIPSNGDPLLDWEIYGDSGGAGDYDESTGKYVIPIKAWYEVYIDNSDPYMTGKYYDPTSLGKITNNPDFNDYGPLLVIPGKNYSLTSISISTLLFYAIFDENMNYLAGRRLSAKVDNGTTFLAPENARYLFAAFNPKKLSHCCLKLTDAVTTDIVLDEPVEAGEHISMTSTGITLPTFEADTHYDTNTSIRPSGMYARFRGL